MKKYQQLLLVVLSVFSFSCLLIYRHEYNKLRYVLNVLSFFGTPGIPGQPNSTSCPNFDSFTKIARGPVPAWQRISDSLFVYSAYWERANKVEQVKAFAVGLMNENLNYMCSLWYESDPKTTKGVFAFSGLPYRSQETLYSKGLNVNKTKPFVLYCKSELNSSHGVPIGVTFFTQAPNQVQQGYIPVFNLKSSFPPQNSSGICVMPTETPHYNRSIYLEFLSFHKIIGINNFIVYGGLDHYNLLSSIHMDKTNQIKITILPWNYPYFGETEIMKSIAENDCKTRLRGLLENVVILEWNKFLVPRFLVDFSSLINELDSGKKANKFIFTTLIFCLEFKDSVKTNSSVPIIFRKFKYKLPKGEFQVPLYRPFLESGSIQKVGQHITAVHQYINCQDHRFILKDIRGDLEDNTMFKFQDDFYKSQILIM